MVSTLLGVACKQPQSAYAGLHKSLQQEWSFVQQVTPFIGDTFGPVEKALRESFLLALVQGIGEGILWGGVTRLALKQAGLDLPYLRMADPVNWTVSCVIKVHLVAALRNQEEFRKVDNATFLRDCRLQGGQRSH